jgi:hypothetical protein
MDRNRRVLPLAVVAVCASLLCNAPLATAEDTHSLYGHWALVPADDSLFGETTNNCTTLPRVGYGAPPYDNPRYWYWTSPFILYGELSPTAFSQVSPPSPEFPAAVPMVISENGGTGSTSFSFTMVSTGSTVLEDGTATATTEVTFSDMSISSAGRTEATITFVTTVTDCTTCPQDPLAEWYAPIPCTRQQVLRGLHTWDNPGDGGDGGDGGGGDGGDACVEVKRIAAKLTRTGLRCQVLGKRGRKLSGKAMRFEVQQPDDTEFTTVAAAVSDAKGKMAFSLAGRSVGDRVRCSVDGCEAGVVLSSRPRVVRRLLE